jgi:aldose 1-epimerase
MSSGVQVIDLKAELDGQPIYQVVLSNANATVSLFSFGATLQSFVVDVPGFKKRDVVLGYPDWTSYQHTFDFLGNAYMGAIIGPIAGRIANARIPWGAHFWQFEANEGAHLLHGGRQSFSNHNWTLKETKDTPYPAVTFELQEKEKFNLPGMLNCQVSYTLTNSALEIEIKSRALEDTIANPTQHGYFNPNGHQGSILDAQSFVCAEGYLELNQKKIPSGEIQRIAQNEDPKEPLLLSDFHQYPQLDIAFVLNKEQQQQARLIAADGFQLTFSTNQSFLQVYIGGKVDFQGKEGQDYHRYSGICLEQQAEPDAPNHKHFSDIYLFKDQMKVNSLKIRFEQ